MGRLFLDGDGSRIHPGIRYVLVDEYQDTNPIQEAIYFAISGNTHNLCIVGDDDQALYRFRGGTVECMVTFDQACNRAWGVLFDTNMQEFLSVNYRSHPDIVAYYDQYISSFAVMRLDRARVRGKPRLSSQSTISGDYPAVAYIHGSRIEEAANNFAVFVRGLLDNNIIEMPSQCALLMKSGTCLALT
jgi:DNA helicase II / ATP-dependent DNA helicase PcrA